MEPAAFGWLPSGLWYHILYAFLAVPVMYVFVEFSWPKNS